MGQVIKFITRKELIKKQYEKTQLELDTWTSQDITNLKKNEMKNWLNNLSEKLSEDDYVDVLESIISSEIYSENDSEIQTIVDGFFNLRNVG